MAVDYIARVGKLLSDGACYRSKFAAGTSRFLAKRMGIPNKLIIIIVWANLVSPVNMLPPLQTPVAHLENQEPILVHLRYNLQTELLHSLF